MNLIWKGNSFSFESDLNTTCVFMVYKQNLQHNTTFINDLFVQAAATRPIDHNHNNKNNKLIIHDQIWCMRWRSIRLSVFLTILLNQNSTLLKIYLITSTGSEQAYHAWVFTFNTDCTHHEHFMIKDNESKIACSAESISVWNIYSTSLKSKGHKN